MHTERRSSRSWQNASRRKHSSSFASVCIREFATGASADLIAIGSEEVPRLQNALLGSVSLDIVTPATCDVLLARVASA